MRRGDFGRPDYKAAAGPAVFWKTSHLLLSIPMRLSTLVAFALGAAAVYTLTCKARSDTGGAEPAPSDPRDVSAHAATTGSPVPPGGDPDLVGT
jgi:hypothetical protein